MLGGGGGGGGVSIVDNKPSAKFSEIVVEPLSSLKPHIGQYSTTHSGVTGQEISRHFKSCWIA